MLNRRQITVFVLLLALTSLFVSTGAAQDTPSGEITVWMQIANQDQIEQTVLPAFLEQYPDVTVEFANYSPTEVAQQLALAIQGGTGAPDVALMESAQVPRLVDLGGLVNLTDLVGEDVEDFVPAALEYGALDDSYYAVPWDVGPVVLYYRRDIFEAAGLPSDPAEVDELVSTWEGYLQVCETIVAETGLPCFALNQAQNFGDTWTNILWSQGEGWYDAEAVTVNSESAVEALNFLGNFWEGDLVSDDLEWTDAWYASLNETELEDATVPPVATIPIAAWMGGFLKNWAAPDAAGLWGVVQFPAFADGARSSNQGGSSYVIPEQSDNQDAAWAFIDFVNSTESQIALFDYGDIFPARISAYEDPIFAEGDDYFAGQAVREVYAEAAQNLPVANIYGVYYPVMDGQTDTAIQRFATGDASAEDALNEAAEVIRLETGLD